MKTCDVAVIGGGLAGMATAARLQSAGMSTVVFEAHGQPGGCAGFFRRKGFAFDVGATTLVDFSPGGIGGDLLDDIGLSDLLAEELPGYIAWLPDRQVALHRDPAAWRRERVNQLGDSWAHTRLWQIFDRLADVFWSATRRGLRLPAQSPLDLVRIAADIPLADWPMCRFLNWTVGDLLRSLGLRGDDPLCGLLGMLLEDTVHAKIDDAPLINGSLGITIRGAGLSRIRGGMFGFWKALVARYRELGGVLRVGCPVTKVTRNQEFIVESRRVNIQARNVVSALPVELTANIAPPVVREQLQPFLRRDRFAVGGALVLFLGVPEQEVAGRDFTHHQLMHDYRAPLGNGNNMFLSVSSPGDTQSAPAGHRSVMISTHCELAEWEGLSDTDYAAKKELSSERLLHFARRVYPNLGTQAVVREFATPRTFERYTHRPRGAVGGFRQFLSNTNLHAIPHRTVLPGFWLAGDTTWPGLGTVACVHCSRLVADDMLSQRLRSTRRPSRLAVAN